MTAEILGQPVQHGAWKTRVLHYDRDYDVIAAHTSLDFASEWVAPAGSLD